MIGKRHDRLKKRFVSIVLFFTIILMTLCDSAISVKADGGGLSGICGDNLYWNYDVSSYQLTISGTGVMYDYTTTSSYDGLKTDVPWGDYLNSIKKVKVENGVTSIGKSAFSDCTSLIQIELPSTLLKIGNSSFARCTSLPEIIIPSSVTEIEGNVFAGCSLITNIVIPDKVTVLKGSTFAACSKLQTITLPSNLVSIGYAAFNSCSSLSKIILPNTLTKIESDAFFACKSLTEIEIPESVKDISSEAFLNCSNLAKATIYNDTVKFGNDTWKGCSSRLILYGNSDSATETYAAENGITFVSLNSEDADLYIKSFETNKQSGQNIGEEINFTAKASGGTAPYQYMFYYIVDNVDEHIIQKYSTNAMTTFGFIKSGTYQIGVRVKDSDNNIAEKIITNFQINGFQGFAGGDGTESNPYQIADAAMFCEIENQPGAYYILIADITLPLTDSFEYVESFSGNLDGKGHTITIKETPLFGGTSAHIQNMKVIINANTIKIDNSVVEDYFGAVARYNIGTIERVETKGTVNAVFDEVYYEVGGISGVNDGTIKYCHNDIDFTITEDAIATDSTLGGISGTSATRPHISGTAISECWNSGNLSLTKRDRVTMAAIVQHNENGGIAGDADLRNIKNCVNSGNISINYTQIYRNSSIHNYIGFISGDEYYISNYKKDQEHSAVGTNCFIEKNAKISVKFSDYFDVEPSYGQTFYAADVSYPSKTLDEIQEWWDELIKKLEDEENSDYSINAFSIDDKALVNVNKSGLVYGNMKFSKKMTSDNIVSEINQIKLESSDPSIAEITNCTRGLSASDMKSTAFYFNVIAHKEGTVTVTCTASNGMKAECIITVTPETSGDLKPTDKDYISCPKEKRIAIEEKAKVSAELIASSEQKVTTLIKNLTVSSNDESVCKVNLGQCFKDIEAPSHAYFDMELIGVKPGETDIIVSAGSGVSVKCHVTVTSENFFGTSLETFRDEDLSANISIEWDINSLINIGGRDTSLALEGLLLSQDTYSGEDAVAERMMSFGLLDKGGLSKYEDPNTKTGWCCFVGVRKVSVGDEYYNIITASARGTVGDNYMIEWLKNLLYTEGFFKLRGDGFYTQIVETLRENGIERIDDPHNRFFITGHSLGGAISGYVSDKLMQNNVDSNQIACYTYASPFNYRNPSDGRKNAHIYNYIGIKDVVPTVGQATNYYVSSTIPPLPDNSLCWGTHRYGNDIPLGYGDEFLRTYFKLYEQVWKYDYDYDDWRDGSTAGNITHLGGAWASGDAGAFHHLSTYLAQILMDEDYHIPVPDHDNILTVAVLCPVDVCVKDADGKVVANVEDNIVVNEGNDNAVIAVMGDAKFITLKKEMDYTVDFVGTDTGTMSYIVTDNNSPDDEVKIFTNVALEKEKQMSSVIKKDESAQDVKLFVMNEEHEKVSEIDEFGVESDLISDISYCKITLSKTSYTYDGKAKIPIVTVELNGKTLALNSDYTVSYSNNINVGTATVTVTGIGSYTGTVTKNFTITSNGEGIGGDTSRIRLTEAVITLSQNHYAYDGWQKLPTVTVKLNGKTLALNSDYTVSYSNNINVGTATITVTGIGSYTGTVTKNFTITSNGENIGGDTSKISITEAAIILSQNHYAYDGWQKRPSVTVKLNGKTLKVNEDYLLIYHNNIDVGTAQVIIIGKGKYTGYKSVDYTIAKSEKQPDFPIIRCKKKIYKTAYGAKPFTINATSESKLLFTSSKPVIVSVDKNTGQVTVKGTGIAAITIKAGRKAVSVLVKVSPKKPSLKSVNAVKGRQLTVKWAKDKMATGYQVQVSTAKNFKRNLKTKNVSRTSYTFTKLKTGKKYYVRMRSYKKSGMETLYGTWSRVKQSNKIKN